jgi:NTE family protein
MTSEFPRTGLALSGGGYRATAFHLGTLRQLHKLGILNRIDVLSTISGGSITGAYYCSQIDKDFNTFYDALYKALLTKDVIKKTLVFWLGLRILVLIVILLGAIYLLFTCYAWLFLVIFVLVLFLLARYQFVLFPMSKRIEQVYDNFFYEKNVLSSLPLKPKLIIGSTNLQTARPFSFTKTRMWDTSYGSKGQANF